jgi:hypothetical protein
MADFEIVQDFPASLSRLWETLGRRDYAERKYRALGSTALQIKQFDSTPQRIEVRLERTLRVEPNRLPAWAFWLSGPQQRLDHHSCWTRVGAREAAVELRVSAAGHAVRAHATGSVTELDPGHTRMRLHVTVECPVPVIGRRIAHLFADRMKQALEQDHAFTVRYLVGDDASPASAATRPAGARRRSRSDQ